MKFDAKITIYFQIYKALRVFFTKYHLSSISARSEAFFRSFRGLLPGYRYCPNVVKVPWQQGLRAFPSTVCVSPNNRLRLRKSYCLHYFRGTWGYVFSCFSICSVLNKCSANPYMTGICHLSYYYLSLHTSAIFRLTDALYFFIYYLFLSFWGDFMIQSRISDKSNSKNRILMFNFAFENQQKRTS